MQYRFGSCTLDTRRRELLTAEGALSLRPKVFDLLAYLIGHRDRVVSKQELFDQLWPDVHVGDATLNTCVKAARQAVGDSGRAQTVIRTWHGHGYRFVAAVEERPEESRRGDVGSEAADLPPGQVASRQTASSPESLDSGTSGAPAAPDKPSIAVLPFSTIGSAPDQEYFGRGLTEDLITDLSRISGLFVIAQGSMLSYEGQSPDPRSVAKRLGVRYVLEGSIRMAGDRLRISAQLVDTQTGIHLWAERYDRSGEDIFDLQDNLTKEIVTALRVQLTDGENAQVWSRGTESIEAWKLATQAVDPVLEYSATGNLRARELSRRAVEIDPGYAPAWGILGITYWYDARLGGGDDAEALMREAEACAEKAASIDDANPWVIGLQAYILVSRGRHDAAIETAKRGIDRNPSSADLRGYLGYCLMNAGRPREAVRAFDQAMRLNPLYPIWYRALMARALDASGEPGRAAEVARAALRVHADNFPCQLHLASLLGRDGKTEEAAAYVAGVLRRAPSFTLDQAGIWLSTRDQEFKQRYLDGLREAGLPG